MRKLLIGTDVLRMVKGDKDLIEVLAFAILIKQSRINSVITHATQRKLKSLFGIGADKLRKLVANGLSSGFLMREGDSIIATRLHKNHGLCYTMEGWLFVDAANRSRNKKLTLASVKRMVEIAILYNHVSMQESCEDTHRSASSESKPLKAIKRAMRREKSMLRGSSYNDRMRVLSYKKIGQLTGMKKSTNIRIVKESAKLGLLYKVLDIHTINAITPEECGKVSQSILRDHGIIVNIHSRSAYSQYCNVFYTKTPMMKLANNR